MNVGLGARAGGDEEEEGEVVVVDPEVWVV